jgi:hypothetical protein
VASRAAPHSTEHGDHGYFECSFERFLREQRPRLLALDPAWDIGTLLPDGHGRPKPLMWHQYRVELYPMFAPPFSSLSRAHDDPLGAPIFFSTFFRRGRDGTPRGIVRLTP